MDTIINPTVVRELVQASEPSTATRAEVGYDELLNTSGFVGRIIEVPSANPRFETVAMIEEIEPSSSFGRFDLLVRVPVENPEVEDEVLFLEGLYIRDIEAMLSDEQDCDCADCEALR